MRKTTFLVLGASALALSGCDLETGNQANTPVWARGPVIEAQGRAYIEQLPNRAQFSVTFEGRAPASPEASRQAVERANLATEAIRLASDGEVRVTSNLSVAPYYEQVTQRVNEYSERLVENRHPDALLGYVATVSVQVVMLNPETTSDARGAALAAGPVNSSAVSFFLEPTAENQRAAFAAAVQDATERAAIVAEAAGSRLGTIAVLQEGSGHCLGAPSTQPGFEDSIMVTGSRNQRDGAVSNAPPPSPPPPSPGGAEGLLENLDRFALAADQEPQRVTASVCAIFTVED